MECVLNLKVEQFRFGQTIFGADSDFLPSDHATPLFTGYGAGAGLSST